MQFKKLNKKAWGLVLGIILFVIILISLMIHPPITGEWVLIDTSNPSPVWKKLERTMVFKNDELTVYHNGKKVYTEDNPFNYNENGIYTPKKTFPGIKATVSVGWLYMSDTVVDSIAKKTYTYRYIRSFGFGQKDKKYNNSNSGD